MQIFALNTMPRETVFEDKYLELILIIVQIRYRNGDCGIKTSSYTNSEELKTGNFEIISDNP